MRCKYLTPLLVSTLMLVCGFCANSFATVPRENNKALNRADRALRSGDFDRAEQIYRDLLTKDDSELDARLGLSLVLLKEKRLEEALEQAARVVAINPLSARAHALIGASVLASGDFPLATQEFHTALNLNENEALAVAGLALVDYYENRMGQCLAGLRRAVSMDGNEPDYVFYLGQAAARSEHYKEAADAYERFLQIAPRKDTDRRARIRGLIDFLRYLGQQGTLYEIAGSDHTVIPFDDPDFRPVLNLRVNGSKESLRFVLDTGSGMSVLSDETARKLGVKAVARGGLARAVGGGGRFEIVYGYLNSIDIGDIKIINVPVYIRHFFDEKNPVDGYLGIAALGKLLASIDYGTQRLTLDRQRQKDLTANAPPSNAATQRLGINVPVRTTASGFLSGEVMVDGFTKPMNFIIDTGATVTVLSDKAAGTQPAQDFIRPTRMRVYGAAGIADDVKVALLPKLAIGSCSRDRVDAAVLSLESVNETAGFLQSGILGDNFLRHYRVIFDFPRGILRLEPLETGAIKGYESVPNSQLPNSSSVEDKP